MKIRNGFVTNSSSSSFLISKKILDEDQIYAIRNHGEIGEELGLSYAEDAWGIDENDDYISGSTYMDNFDMAELLGILGISRSNIVWSDSCQSLIPNDDLKMNPFNVDKVPEEDWRQAVHKHMQLAGGDEL